MLKIFRNLGTRLDCVHVVPGDARNKLVEEIVNSDLVTYGVVAIYCHDNYMEKHCLELGIPFCGLGFRKKHLLWQFVSLFFYVLTTRPKSLYLHSFYPSLLGVGLVFLSPFTKIISVRHHNAVHLLSNNRKGALADKIIAKMAFRTIAVSYAVKETMIRQGCKSEKILVINNGIRLAESTQESELPTSNLSKVRLLAAGRLDWQKNYETMLQVAVELKKRDVDFDLFILGTGSNDYGSSLFEMTKFLGVEDCVKWQGWQPNIEKWFLKSDIFLHTALDEACPLVLIEALLAGLPVIASDAAGSAEVTSGFAFSCGVNDVNAYADQIVFTWGCINEIALKARNQIPLVEEKFGVVRMRTAYEASTLFMLNGTSIDFQP